MIRYFTCIYYRCTGKVDSEQCIDLGQGANILPPVISAKIHTKNTFSFKYGRIEVIAKLSEGDWIYPGIFFYFPFHPRERSL